MDRQEVSEAETNEKGLATEPSLGMDGPAKAQKRSVPTPRKLKRPYDLGVDQNDELPRLIIEGALLEGFPKTKCLFKLHMMNREWKGHVIAAVRPRIVAINGLHEEYRRTVLVQRQGKRLRPHISEQTSEQMASQRKENEDRLKAAKDLTDAYAVFIGGPGASNFVSWMQLKESDRRNDIHFRLTWTLLAAMTLERCMACAGVGVICASTLKQKTIMQWPCGQARMCMAARAKCVENQTIETRGLPQPLGWVEQETRELKTDADYTKWTNGLLARSMLAQKNIFTEQPHDILNDAAWDAFFGKKDSSNSRPLYTTTAPIGSRRLFLLFNNYVPKDRTLQGRLGLTDKGIKRAKADAGRVSQMKWEEDKARFEARLKKWTTDFDVYTKRISQGRLTWKTLCKTYPSLEKTTRRMVHLHDPLFVMRRWHRKEVVDPSRGYIYTNGMGIERFRNLVFQVQYAAAYLGPWDARHVGAEHAASAEAQEWACWLFGGVADGPTGSHRAELDKIRLPRIYPRSDVNAKFGYQKGEVLQVPLAEQVAAMHVFDKIGKVGVEFTVGEAAIDPAYTGPHAVDFFWEVLTSTPRIFLYGHVPRRTHDDLILWHSMLLSAFQKLESKPDIELPKSVPSRKVSNGVLSRDKAAIKEMASYYKEIATLALFSGTRALLFHFLGITVAEVGRLLRLQFEQWQKGTCAFTKHAPAPPTMLEYYKMVAGAEYCSASGACDKKASALALDELPMTDDDEFEDSDDDEARSFHRYSPTSPSYSPTDMPHNEGPSDEEGPKMMNELFGEESSEDEIEDSEDDGAE